MARLLPTAWLMITKDGFYAIQPSDKCKPEDHGRLNDHVIRIEDAEGKTLWARPAASGGLHNPWRMNE